MGRHVGKGDRAPALDAYGIERFEVTQGMDSAQGALANAVRDVLAGAAAGDVEAVANWLAAVARGTSPDDLMRLRDGLLEQDEPVFGTPPVHGDDELAADWRTAAYPYRNLMRRKAY
jgi:polyphosphate kinase